MEMLTFINNNIIKYILIVLGIVLFIYVIKLLTELKTTSKCSNHISQKIENIKNNINNIKKDIAKIEYTKEKSIPLFVDIFLVSVIACAAYKDYKKTKRSRRSVAKSTIKEYLRVQDIFKFKTSKFLKNILLTIKKVA